MMSSTLSGPYWIFLCPLCVYMLLIFKLGCFLGILVHSGFKSFIWYILCKYFSLILLTFFSFLMPSFEAPKIEFCWNNTIFKNDCLCCCCYHQASSAASKAREIFLSILFDAYSWVWVQYEFYLCMVRRYTPFFGFGMSSCLSILDQQDSLPKILSGVFTVAQTQFIIAMRFLSAHSTSQVATNPSYGTGIMILVSL